MAIQTRHPTVFTATRNGGWLNPSNVGASDNVYASASVSYGAIIGTTFSGILFDIPAGSTINSVKLKAEHKITSVGSIPVMKYFEKDSVQGQQVWSAAPPTVDTIITVNAIYTYTAAQLNAGAYTVEVWCTHNVSARTFHIDDLYVEVDYTPPTSKGRFAQII